MDEVIRLLREETVLCSRLTELFAELKKVLTENSPQVSDAVQKIEPVMRELSENELAAKKFLRSVNAKNFEEFVFSQQYSIQRELSERLLKQSASLHERLRNLVEETGRLLKTGRAFVDFNLNILSRTTTNNIYGATSETKSSGGRRIFDANV